MKKSCHTTHHSVRGFTRKKQNANSQGHLRRVLTAASRGGRGRGAPRREGTPWRSHTWRPGASERSVSTAQRAGPAGISPVSESDRGRQVPRAGPKTQRMNKQSKTERGPERRRAGGRGVREGAGLPEAQHLLPASPEANGAQTWHPFQAATFLPRQSPHRLCGPEQTRRGGPQAAARVTLPGNRPRPRPRAPREGGLASGARPVLGRRQQPPVLGRSLHSRPSVLGKRGDSRGQRPAPPSPGPSRPVFPSVRQTGCCPSTLLGSTGNQAEAPGVARAAGTGRLLRGSVGDGPPSSCHRIHTQVSTHTNHFTE